MIPQMWSKIPEDLIAPEPALPAQVNHIWHHSRAISPERALILAVMSQTILDLEKFRFARRIRDQRLYMEAYEWVASEDRSWPYSFENICDALNLRPESVRAELLQKGGESEAARALSAAAKEIAEAA